VVLLTIQADDYRRLHADPERLTVNLSEPE
jgi:hypothetical protein